MNARVFAQSIYTWAIDCPGNFTVQCLRSSDHHFLIKDNLVLWPFSSQMRVRTRVETSLTELGEAGSFTPVRTLANVNALVYYLPGSLVLFPSAANRSSSLSQWCRHWHWVIRVLLLQSRKERARWHKITTPPPDLATPRHGMAAMSQSCGSSS